MAHGRLASIVRHIRRLVGNLPGGDDTDSQLLARFVAGGDEAAFGALVERHGPLVLGVCRHVLRDPHAAEDAFQATFLVLVRKAGSIRRGESLAGWLYRVAYHLAVRARAGRSRPEAGTSRPSSADVDPATLALGSELRCAVRDEVHRLPERYRLPVLLAYFEGRTNEETARALGWPVGTVKTRLNRARDLLRRRLSRRGLGLSTAALSIVLAPGVLSAAVPPALARATAAAVLSGGAPLAVLALAETAARGLLTAKTAVASVLLLSVGLLVAGQGLGGGHDQAPTDPPPPEPQATLTVSHRQEPQAAPAPPRRRGPPLAITIARVLIRRLDIDEEHCLIEAEFPPGVVLVPVDQKAPRALDLLLLLGEPALRWQVLDLHERDPPPG